MKPYYKDEFVTLYHGDCFEILNTIPKADLVLTDPPYIQEFHDRGMSKDRPNHKAISNYGSNTTLDYSKLLNILMNKINEQNLFFFCDKETKHNLITFAIKKKLGYKELCFFDILPRLKHLGF